MNTELCFRFYKDLRAVSNKKVRLGRGYGKEAAKGNMKRKEKVKTETEVWMGNAWLGERIDGRK
jgi:hypothetical protein